MTYSTCSAWAGDLARKLRAIEEELHRCDRAAAGRKGSASGSWRTTHLRGVLDGTADELELMSEEWADERI